MEQTTGRIKAIPKLRIAIIEDDSAAAFAISEMLEDSGYVISDIFCTGKRAVKEIPQTEPDVILINILLTGALGGIETAERIMLTQNIPVVFIAGRLDQINVSRMSFTTNYTVLLKPFTSSELVEAVETVYKKYTKSVNFYRECRSLIREINPYRNDFAKKAGYLIKKLPELELAEDYGRKKYLLNAIRSHFNLNIDTEEPSIITDKMLERQMLQIIRCADKLLKTIDGMDTEEIKNHISRISIYLKVFLNFIQEGNIPILRPLL